MIHFDVLAFNTNHLTRAIDLCYAMELSDKPNKTYHLCFDAYDKACIYLMDVKRTWFLEALSKWVLHKRHIIDNTSIELPNRDSIKSHLIYCENFIANVIAKNQPINIICQRFINGKLSFETIIPHQSNKSYTSALNTYNYLYQFALNNSK